MQVRAVLLAVAAALVLGLVQPAQARIDHIRDLRDAGKGAANAGSAVTTTVVKQTTVTQIGDKQQVEIKIGALTQISDDELGRREVIQLLYLRFTTEVTKLDLEMIAALPQSCQFEECGELEPEMVVKVADIAIVSLGSDGKRVVGKRVKKAKRTPTPAPSPSSDDVADADDYVANGGANAGGGKAVDDPPDAGKGGSVDNQVNLVDVTKAAPWWREWLSPAIVIALIGVVISAFTAWFGVMHQRHQMRMEERAAATAAVVAPVMAVASSVPLMQPPGTPASPPPAPDPTPKARSRSATPGASKRSRTRA